MLFKLGHIPKPGESVEFEGRRFTVAAMERNRIATVRIEKLPAAQPATTKAERRKLLGIDPKAAALRWTAALVLLAARLVYLIRETLFVFVIALLFAYLLYPLMDLIDRHLPSKTRTPALAMTFILVIGILAGFRRLRSARWSPARPPTSPAQAPAFLDRLQPDSRPRPQGVTSLDSRVQRRRSKRRFAQHYGDIVSCGAPR